MHAVQNWTKMLPQTSIRRAFWSGKKSIFLFAALAAVFFFSSGAWADIYKFVDEEGVIHFTNVPTHGKYKLFYREKPVHFDRKLAPELEKYDLLIYGASEKYNIDHALIKAVIKAESNFNPKAVSRVGAQGLMQLMPKTAYALEVKDSFKPEENIEGGVRYLTYLLNLYRGDLYLALAAYNAGEKAVTQYKGVPPYRETQTYIQRVLRFYQEYRAESKNSSPVNSSN
jgi:soluble lytic murein transglycosylase-like protein